MKLRGIDVLLQIADANTSYSVRGHNRILRRPGVKLC
jgi:hypothetical protein